MFGGDGDDSLFGGDGNDLISGGTGKNELDGGDGEDVAAFSRGIEKYQFTVGEDGDLHVEVDGNVTRLVNFEKIRFEYDVFPIEIGFANVKMNSGAILTIITENMEPELLEASIVEKAYKDGVREMLFDENEYEQLRNIVWEFLDANDGEGNLALEWVFDVATELSDSFYLFDPDEITFDVSMRPSRFNVEFQNHSTYDVYGLADLGSLDRISGFVSQEDSSRSFSLDGVGNFENGDHGHKSYLSYEIDGLDSVYVQVSIAYGVYKRATELLNRLSEWKGEIDIYTSGQVDYVLSLNSASEVFLDIDSDGISDIKVHTINSELENETFDVFVTALNEDDSVDPIYIITDYYHSPPRAIKFLKDQIVYADFGYLEDEYGIVYSDTREPQWVPGEIGYVGFATTDLSAFANPITGFGWIEIEIDVEEMEVLVTGWGVVTGVSTSLRAGQVQ